jgi:hypothetical protein
LRAQLARRILAIKTRTSPELPEPEIQQARLICIRQSGMHFVLSSTTRCIFQLPVAETRPSSLDRQPGPLCLAIRSTDLLLTPIPWCFYLALIERISHPHFTLSFMFLAGFGAVKMTGIIYTELPNEPTFVQLLRVSREVHHIIVHDPWNRVDAGYAQFLTDLLRMRESLYKFLPSYMFDEQNILREDNPYIFILSRGDYEFIVAAFAILSIGGALVPLCELLIMTVLGVEEID